MSENKSFEASWAAYQQSVRDLYAAPPPVARAAERGGGAITGAQAEQRSAVLVASASQVRTSLAAAMQTQNMSQRELAGLKLMAALASDLSVAGDLLQDEHAGGAERGARAAFATSNVLRDVMNAPLASGMTTLVEPERPGFSTDPTQARAQLEKEVGDFVTGIPQLSAGISKTALTGLGTVGLGPAQGLVTAFGPAILDKVPAAVSPIVRAAANLVVEAIRKLTAAISPEQEEQVTAQARKWVDDFKDNADLIAKLLIGIYGTDKIKKDTLAQIDAAPATTAAQSYNKASQSLETLLSTYTKTQETLGGVMKVAGFIKPTLLAALPWGPIAVYGVYTGIIGYATFSGGDYLDWDRLGNQPWLNRVQGLRTVVRNALADAAPAAAGTP